MVNGWIILLVVSVGLLVAFGFVLFLIYASRYKRVPPDQAMVIYGSGSKKGGKGYTVVSGGGKFIMPIFQGYDFLPLDVRTLEIAVTDIVTDVKTSGAKMNIKAVAQVKIASDEASLYTAAEQLLHKTDPEINEIAQKTLEGHVRGICATMTIESINSDRDAVASHVQSQAAKDLRNMSIEIRSFVIKEIEDQYGYLDALGRKRTAEVKRDARIGEAIANKEATIKEAESAREAERANAQAEGQVALFHKERDITKQNAEAEVEVAKANRSISFDLQDRKRRQELVKEEVQIEIEERQKKIELQEREIVRKQKEQEAIQVVPARAAAESKIAEADGEKGRIERIAEAEKSRTIRGAEAKQSELKLTADGEREKLLKLAEGQAEKIRKEGTAEAEVIKLKGEAEAAAIKAKGLAEAEAMEKKAMAWRKYGDAAVTQMIVDQLPEIVQAAASSLEGVDKVIVMGEQGPSGLVGKTVDIAAQMPTLIKSLTGVDVTQLIRNVVQKPPEEEG
ncbi:MAG: SPFH domain-containing protein [Candidatus Thermoplasmatota archaeon]|nr:SPFH domain-containing protein [Candidatus Thermoplasmatota archaeon]